MMILGVNGGLDGYLPLFPTSRDSAAAMLVDGEIALAIEEDRLARERCVGAFPMRGVDACLRAAGLSSLDQVDRIAHARRRMDAFEIVVAGGRKLPRAASVAIDLGLAMARAATRGAGYAGSGSRLGVERALRTRIPREKFTAVPHEVAHTANAFFTSPFESALCVVSTSELSARSMAATIARGVRLSPVDERFVPDSLGLLSRLVSDFLGFSPREESKVVALAAFGDPARYRRFFAAIVQTSADGVTQIERPLLSLLAARGHAWGGRRADAVLAHALGPARVPNEPIERRHQDIAAALEEAIERALLTSLEVLARRTGQRNLCLAGGVALNPVVNGRIARSGIFERVHVAPAAHDAGTALGAALYVEHVLGAAPRRARRPTTAYLGPVRDPVSIARRGPIVSHGVRASRPEGLLTTVARALAAGKIVGWCEGRSEWGESALGHRSILADPRSMVTRDRLDRTVKMRDSYRPFAPAVLAERAPELFDLTGIVESSRMSFCVPVRPAHRATLAAVTHVDGTARIQTVSREDAPSLHAVIRSFEALTGVPVLLNTSLNVNEEPIIETPEDAIHFFLSTGLDMLVVDGVLFDKMPTSLPEIARRSGRARLGRVPMVRPMTRAPSRDDGPEPSDHPRSA